MKTEENFTKPCIAIHVFPHVGCEQKLREITAGMEEEGIPCVVVTSNEQDAVQLAYDGACDSRLGVGVGIGEKNVSIHYAKLPPEQPLFVLNGPGSVQEWRCYGYNAARLVKGIPFKTASQESDVSQSSGSADLYRTISSMITKILQESAQDHGKV
jgi:hypothetical protein